MSGELKAKVTEIYERFRCWIDHETYVPIVFKRTSRADEFAEKIEREIKNVMQKEKFRYQDGKILLPTNYHVFISGDDAAEWKGVKRESLEQRLKKFTSNYIRLISTDSTYMLHHHVVALYVEKTLKNGEVKVIHQWAEKDSPVEIFISSSAPRDKKHAHFSDGEITHFSTRPEAEFSSRESDEETVIKRNSTRLFCLEIWRSGICQNIIPVYRAKVSVGRGSQGTAVDIPLTGDPEISRLHLILTKNDNKNFNVFVQGRNPIFIKQQKLFAGQSMVLPLDEEIKIGSYSLRVKN